MRRVPGGDPLSPARRAKVEVFATLCWSSPAYTPRRVTVPGRRATPPAVEPTEEERDEDDLGES